MVTTFLVIAIGMGMGIARAMAMAMAMAKPSSQSFLSFLFSLIYLFPFFVFEES